MGEAARQIDIFVEQHPQDAEALGVAAMVHLDSGNDERARELAGRALALDPNNLGAIVAQGSLALNVQDAPAAAACFDRAVAKNPASGRAWLGKGMTTLLRADPGAAAGDMRQAVKHMPEHNGSWHALAWCQLLDNDLAGAEETFNHSMEIDRTFDETHGGLAVVYALQNRPEKAKAAIKRARRLNPNCFSARFTRRCKTRCRRRSRGCRRNPNS